MRRSPRTGRAVGSAMGARLTTERADDRRAPLLQRDEHLLVRRVAEPHRKQVEFRSDEDRLTLVAARAARTLVVVDDPPVCAVSVAFFVDRTLCAALGDPTFAQESIAIRH